MTILLVLFLQEALSGEGAGRAMTTGGWAFLILAWTCILLLTFYSFSKVLGGRK